MIITSILMVITIIRLAPIIFFSSFSLRISKSERKSYLWDYVFEYASFLDKLSHF